MKNLQGDIMKNDFLLEPLSKPKRCGKVEINEDSTAGKISTKNPYPMNTRSKQIKNQFLTPKKVHLEDRFLLLGAEMALHIFFNRRRHGYVRK
jgi:hypothetical protein